MCFHISKSNENFKWLVFSSHIARFTLLLHQCHFSLKKNKIKINMQCRFIFMLLLRSHCFLHVHAHTKSFPVKKFDYGLYYCAKKGSVFCLWIGFKHTYHLWSTAAGFVQVNITIYESCHIRHYCVLQVVSVHVCTYCRHMCAVSIQEVRITSRLCTWSSFFNL